MYIISRIPNHHLYVYLFTLFFVFRRLSSDLLVFVISLNLSLSTSSSIVEETTSDDGSGNGLDIVFFESKFFSEDPNIPDFSKFTTLSFLSAKVWIEEGVGTEDSALDDALLPGKFAVEEEECMAAAAAAIPAAEWIREFCGDTESKKMIWFN